MSKRNKARSTASEELSVDSNKNKRIKFDDTDEPKNDSILPSKKKASQTIKINKTQKSKKIIFNDDEPLEVESTSNTEDVPNKQKKSKPPKETRELLEKEEDIKDEDIDKFCDEINEEDNAQFESWVQLIEAKLNSNKKKTK